MHTIFELMILFCCCGAFFPVVCADDSRQKCTSLPWCWIPDESRENMRNMRSGCLNIRAVHERYLQNREMFQEKLWEILSFSMRYNVITEGIGWHFKRETKSLHILQESAWQPGPVSEHVSRVFVCVWISDKKKGNRIAPSCWTTGPSLRFFRWLSWDMNHSACSLHTSPDSSVRSLVDMQFDPRFRPVKVRAASLFDSKRRNKTLFSTKCKVILLSYLPYL